MKLTFTFRHMSGDDELKAYADKKSQKIKKFMKHPIDLHFFFSQQNSQHRTEITVLADHMNYAAEAIEGNKFASVDQALERMESQLRKHKEKTKDHKHFKPVVPKEEFTEETEYDH